MAQELIDKIRAAAQASNVDPDIAVRIAQVESSLNPAAQAKTSSAKGLFQVIDSTWKQYGGKPGKQKDVDENIRVGMNILADNTNRLRSALGREPSASELYAAHFFGPGAAPAVLSASADTPVSELLSARAVKANPQLQGKTAGQVKQMLAAKMGEKPAEPVKATPSDGSESMPDFGAIGRGQLTADLGSGYKAALALSFLADEEDSDEKKLDEEEKQAAKQLAEYKSFNALEGLEFEPTKVPLMTAQAPEQVPVQRFAAGGMPAVPTAGIRPSTRQRLNQARADFDRFNAEADAYNAAISRGEDNAVAPADPMMSSQQYEALVADARKDAARRNMALQVAADPQRYGLSMTKFFADGGEVQEPSIFRVGKYSHMAAEDMFPSQMGQYDQQDAARHMLASAILAKKFGPNVAESLGNLHEITTSPMRWIGSKLGISQMPVDYEQDLHNNRIGIELAARSKSQKELQDLILQEARRARTEQTPGTPWIGKPVRRADGGSAEPTPEELAAASRPATFNPQIARQGQAARRLAAMRDVNTLPDPRTYAAVSGFLGQAPDQQGFSAMHPDIEGIRRAADVGFGAGTALQVAPVVGGAMKLANFAPSSGGRAAPISQMGAVKPRGGHFLTSYGAEKVDGVFPAMSQTEKYARELANTQDQRLNEWINSKLGAYLRRDMGTEMDQFVKAADEGKALHFIGKIPEGNPPYEGMTLRKSREMEGFPASGTAATDYGKTVEMLTDLSVVPRTLEEVSPGLRPQGLQKFVETDPNMRVYELNQMRLDQLMLPTLRDKMAEMRQLPESVSFYGQPAVKVPERYMLQDQTLQGLTPAQASERVAQYEVWKAETKQRMASQSSLKDPNLDRTPAEGGGMWINPPDLEQNPALRELIQDIGCDGGWCTRSENYALSYGSGDKRLTVLLDKNSRPKAQMTVQSRDYGPDDFLSSMDPSEMREFKANNPDLALYQDDSIIATPEYQQWKAMNPPTVSITEIKGVNNETNVRDMPYAKQVQQRVKELDAQLNLQSVENLDGIGMTDLTSKLWGHPAIANRSGVTRPAMQALQQEMARLNGGSRFIENDKDAIDSLIQQAADNILGPEGPKAPTDNAARMIQKSMFQARATGGLIERRPDDSRKYL